MLNGKMVSSSETEQDFIVTDLSQMPPELRGLASPPPKAEFEFYSQCFCPLGGKCPVCHGDVMQDPVRLAGSIWDRNCLIGLQTRGMLHQVLVVAGYDPDQCNLTND